ncbi:MAG: hypothetical protein AAGI48_07795 [Verrucomicrobiota bacterium]
MPDWKPASSVPELYSLKSESPTAAASPAPTPATQSQAENPYAAPTTDWNEASPTSGGELTDLEEIVPGSQPLDIGACISRGFELTKRHFGNILVIGIIMIAISIATSAIMGFVDSLLGWGAPTFEEITGNQEFDEAFAQFSNSGSLLNQVVCTVVDTFLGLGITRIALNIVSGQPFTIGLLFSQGAKTIRAVIAELLFGLMLAVGFLLLIFPGIYLALRFGQYKNAIVDKDMEIFDAFGYSARITEGNKLPILGLFILCMLIVIAGVIALLVGLLFAIPLVTLASIVAYRWMQYGQISVQDR